MPDDKKLQARDRSKVAGEQDYEIIHFAEKHGISIEQAQDLVRRLGNSRAALDAAVEMLKA